MGNTPNIRFKGFTDDWEQRKLGDEAIEMLAGGDIDKSRVVENGKYPIYANALTNNGIVGYYDDYYRVKAPAVTVTGRGDVGHAQARTVDFTPVVRLLAIRSEHDAYFLENAINNHGVIVESTGVPQLTVPQLGNYMIQFPRTIEEETKIGDYFRNLDHLITLHQRKCDEIIELKKYMLQKMFPQNNQKVPELRFVGFTGDWERHKFSNIVMEKLTNGVMNQQSDFQTDVKHINVINMYVSDKIHVEDLMYSSCDNIAVEKCNVEVGDIFLTRSSLKPEGIAEPNVLLDDGCFVFDDHLIRMKVNKEKYDPLFTKILLSTKPVKKQFIAKSKQNAFTTIGQEDIAKSEGLFPSLSEQQEIGKYFSNIDTLITLHQHKCDALKEIKKFMLQNMFPQKG